METRGALKSFIIVCHRRNWTMFLICVQICFEQDSLSNSHIFQEVIHFTSTVRKVTLDWSSWDIELTASFFFFHVSYINVVGSLYSSLQLVLQDYHSSTGYYYHHLRYFSGEILVRVCEVYLLQTIPIFRFQRFHFFKGISC